MTITKKNKVFLSNAGPDPLKNHKDTKQHSMLGYHQHASEIPIKWRFAGGPMMARLKWYLDPLLSTTKKHCQKWTPSDKTFWIRAWLY